jgi:hypothetical protein
MFSFETVKLTIPSLRRPIGQSGEGKEWDRPEGWQCKKNAAEEF